MSHRLVRRQYAVTDRPANKTLKLIAMLFCTTEFLLLLQLHKIYWNRLHNIAYYNILI